MREFLKGFGAAKTSTYYVISPFIGIALSFVIFREILNMSFITALVIMISGTYFASTEVHNYDHKHTQDIHHSHSR